MPNQARRPERRILGREKRRATPFAPEADALPEAEQAEQPGRDRAGRSIAGQDADQRRRKSHDQHGGHEGRLAADAVAEMPEEHRADRTRQERDAEGQERS